MTIPLWCLFIATFLPLVAAGAGSVARSKMPGGADNNNPRQQALQLEGFGARAYAAQANAWESLAVFTVAVFINHVAQGAASTSALLAVLFIAARLGHLGAYLGDKGGLRSGFFGIGFLCCIGLVILGAMSA